MKRYRERRRKKDWRRKAARLIVAEAYRRRYGIILEKLTPKSVWNMLSRIENRKLRLRIAKACFLGVIKAVKEYAALYGVPVVEVNPAYTSRLCPIHGCELEYDGKRTALCPVGGEAWHRETTGTYNIARRGGAPTPSKPATPVVIPREAWARARSIEHALELAKQRRPKALRLAEKYGGYIRRL